MRVSGHISKSSGKVSRWYLNCITSNTCQHNYLLHYNCKILYTNAFMCELQYPSDLPQNTSFLQFIDNETYDDVWKLQQLVIVQKNKSIEALM